MKKSIAVWTWIPGAKEPTLCGDFTLDTVNRVGAFRYETAYLGSEGKVALDPINLPLRRSVMKTLLQGGIFGVMKDAGPDAWGRDVLFHEHGEIDDIEVLGLAPQDSCGAILFGDAERKLAEPIPELAEIDAAISAQDLGRVRRDYAEAIMPTTSLGGAKPKFTVMLDGAQWILKLPEKGDSAFIAHNEHVMLEMAIKCGMDACESRIHQLPDGRTAFLVKRFDRQNHSRIHYASAHTVLGLGDPRQDTLARKSYVRFADEFRRWCKDAAEINAQELWRRIVYNTLVGNADDHTRNHGLVYSAEYGAWRLSSMFDVVAAPKPTVFALAMAYHQQGAVVDLDRLAATAANFGVSHTDAVTQLQAIAAIVQDEWERRLGAVGVDSAEIDRLRTAFQVSAAALSHEFKDASGPRAGRRRYGR